MHPKRMRASRSKPCPVCGRGNGWCLVGLESAICMVVQSDLEVDCGGAGQGWIHDLASRNTGVSAEWACGRKRHRERPSDVSLRVFPASRRQLGRLTEILGPSLDSWVALMVGYRAGKWQFPERDANGQVIGLLERTQSGRKLVVPGSRRGIYLGRERTADSDGPVFLTEGATDTATAISAGLSAIGRPNNAAGAEHIAPLIRGRRAVVVGDNDATLNGWPGLDGALSLATKLKKLTGFQPDLVLPPLQYKDMREWYAAEGRNVADELMKQYG